MSSRSWKYLCCIVICLVLAGVIIGSLAPEMSLQGDPSTGTSQLITTAPTGTSAPVTTAPQPTDAVTAGPTPTEPAPTEPAPTKPTLPETKPTEPTPEIKVEIPKLSAKYAFVYDLRTGEFLYNSCKTNKSLYPASTTKLYTTYVALKYLKMDQLVTVGSELSCVESDASVVGFKKGDTVSVEALAYGALLPSGCDASYILAAAAGRVILEDPDATAKEAIQAFLAECNRLGKKWGMKNTNFASPDGYHHDEHYISVQAFAIIGKLCLKNADIARITTSATATITYTNAEGERCTKTFKNTNRTVREGDKYYHSNAVGLKTGFTDQAGYCLLTAYRVEDGYILVGIFHCSSASSRFADANKLFEAFEPYL